MIKKKENPAMNPSMKLNVYLKNPIIEKKYLKQMISNVKNKRLLNIVMSPTDEDFELLVDEWSKMSDLRKIQLRLQVILMKSNYKYIIFKTKISSFILFV
jgi:hypothetical protein